MSKAYSWVFGGIFKSPAEDFYKQQIKNHTKYLSGITRNLAEVTILLYQKDVLTLSERQRIFSHEDEYEQYYHLYTLLLKKSSLNLFAFLDVLSISDNLKIVKFLQSSPEDQKRQMLASNEKETSEKLEEGVQNNKNKNNNDKRRKMSIFSIAENKENCLEFIGNESRLKIFPAQISLKNLEGSVYGSMLRILRLDYVNLNAFDLISSLRGCVNISSIEISHAIIKGEFEKLSLPRLKQFIYHEIKGHRTYHYQLKKHFTKKKLLSILFFSDFTSEDDIDFESLWSLGVNIYICYDEWVAFKIDHYNYGEIISDLDYLQIDDLGDSETPIKYLSLRESCFEKSRITLSFLTYLNFYDVQINNNDLTSVLLDCAMLENFYFWPKYVLDCGSGAGLFSLKLEILPKSLKKVSLRLTNLELKLGLSLLELDLVSLTLDKCAFPDHLDANFHNVFRAQKVAIFAGPWKLPNEILLNSLLKIENIEKICIEFYETKKVGFFRRQLLKGDSVERKITNFLKTAGITHDQDSFLLRKLKSSNGIWKGKRLDEEQKSLIWDQAFDYRIFCVDYYEGILKSF